MLSGGVIGSISSSLLVVGLLSRSHGPSHHSSL
jgi:hypothetical protein